MFKVIYWSQSYFIGWLMIRNRVLGTIQTFQQITGLASGSVFISLFNNLKIKLTALVDEELFYCQMNSFPVVKAVKHVFLKDPRPQKAEKAKL